MLNFIAANYVIFIIIAVILLLGLFGYLMDRKKYEEYRREFFKQDMTYATLEKAPSVSPVAEGKEVENNK